MAVGSLLRRPAALLLLLCAVPALLLTCAGPAAAHAALVRSTPGQDTVTATAPREVVLTFTEDVSVPSEGLRVLGPDGLRTDDRRPGHAGGDGRTARIALKTGLPDGSYVVSWRVVSADSHPVSGGFTFSVGHPSAAPAAPPLQDAGGGTVGVLYDVGRGAAYTGFALLVGGAAFAGLCRTGTPPRPLRRLVLTGWALLLASTAALLVLRTPYESGGTFDLTALRETLGGKPALVLLARLALVALLGAALRRALRATAAVLACAAAATWAAAEHASAGLQVPLAIPVDLLHTLAASVWLGGLAALLVTLHRTADPLPETARSAARFSRLAQAAVAVLAVTGAYQAWRQVGAWHALTDTGYGRILLAKLAAVGALLAAARYSRRWTARLRETAAQAVTGRVPAAVPAGGAAPGPAAADPPEPGREAERRQLRRSVAAEAAIGALVLALTAVLTSTGPSRAAALGAGAAVAPDTPAPTVYAEVPFDTGAPGGRGKGKVVIVMDPGRAGDNSLQAVVLTRGEAVAVVPELRIRMALPDRGVGPLDVPLEQRGGAWEADDLRVPLPGRWTLTVAVRTSDIDESTATTRVDIPAYR